MGPRSVALASMMVLALLLVPSSIVAADVSVFPAQVPYDKSVDAGSPVTFEWAIYNPRNETIIVMTTTDATDLEGVTGAVYDDIGMVDPGETHIVTVTIETDYYAPSGTNRIGFVFNITGVASGDSETIHQEAGLEIDSRFITGTNINRIFLIWDNDLPPPLDGNIGAYLITMGGWILIAAAVSVVIEPAIGHIVRRFGLRFLGRVAKGLKLPVMATILVFGSFSSLRILDVRHRTFATMEMLGDVVIIILVGWMVWVVYRETVHHMLGRISDRTDSEATEVVEPIMDNMGKIIIPVAVVMAIFNVMGYDLTFVLAGAGITGLVLGLALQDTLSNFFSGLYLMISRPFKVGDLVEMEDGVFCQVEKVGFRNTTLLNIIDMEHFIVPNNNMANSRITNIAEPDPSLRIHVQVGVEYGTDTDIVRAVLFEVANENRNVHKAPGRMPTVRFEDFGDDSLVFQLWAWVDEARDWWDIASDIRLAIDRKFREKGIVVAFPQRTVWINEDPRSPGEGSVDNREARDK